jgi:imidazolonepropionase
MNVDLIIKTDGQLVTCASPVGSKRGSAMRDVGIITGGAIAINDGVIIDVGNAAEIQSTHATAELFDAGDRVICPGFVDPHTHIVYAGERLDEFESKLKGADYLEILAAGGGILSTVKETREAAVGQLVEGGLKRLGKMLQCGTTTAEVKTGYGLDLETELKMLRAIEQLDQMQAIDIVPTFLAAHAVPQEHKADPNTYVDLICEIMLPAAWGWYKDSGFFERTPFFVDIFTERNAFDVGQMSEIFTEARNIGFKTKAHVGQFTDLGGSRLAIEMGAVSIDHLDNVYSAEIELLAASDTVGIVTPTVNFNMGSCRFADARQFIDSGCAVAVSTDFNPGSAPCPSQQLAMAIACRYQKLVPSEALNAATINAAHGCGVGDRAGSFERGKKADILILDADDFRQVVYEFGGNSVRNVFKAGVVVA